MNENPPASSPSSNNSKFIIAFFWILSLAFTGYLCFAYGKGSVQIQSNDDKKVLNAQTVANVQEPVATPEQATTLQSDSIPADTNTVSSAVMNTRTCTKTGFAQKWEYLTPYVVKANDTLQSIATDQLKDGTRVNELLQLNGVGPYVVGSTLYLPPASVVKSSGNIKQVYGKLVEKNDTSWHISFTSDKSGQGVLIPSFLFTGVSNNDSFALGDCVSVLFDDGYKIYSLTEQ